MFVKAGGTKKARARLKLVPQKSQYGSSKMVIMASISSWYEGCGIFGCVCFFSSLVGGKRAGVSVRRILTSSSQQLKYPRP